MGVIAPRFTDPYISDKAEAVQPRGETKLSENIE